VDALGDVAVDDGGQEAAEAAPEAEASAAGCPAGSTFSPTTAKELLVAGDSPTQGIFDPSIVYPAGAAQGAMAYSAVPNQETIRTHIAVSTNNGASWTLAVEANTPEATTLPSTDATECPGGSCSGNLISEVPSLVFDQDEPDATKAYKLFSFRYLVGLTGTLHYTIGTIALQTAPAPAGPWTPPKSLLGWNSPSTYSTMGVVANVSNFADTADCLLLTEPGALWRPGALDLALGCTYPYDGGATTRIVLLRSIDHGASWTSVGTMLGASDGSCVMGSTGVNAADLFVSGGNEYLSATPGATSGEYEGCLIFPVTDPTTGAVPRNGAGKAVTSRYIAPSPLQFSGACTYADGAGGYVLNVGFLSAGVTRNFRIFTPGITAP
jgi:hypothetical protein